MLAKAIVVSASLVPAGRGLKWTYRMLKIFQRLKASEDVPLNLTEHGADQALKRGFTQEAIKKIMDEGTAAPGAGRYGPQTRYTLGENTVIVNEKDQIVTVYSSDMPSGNFIPFK